MGFFVRKKTKEISSKQCSVDRIHPGDFKVFCALETQSKDVPREKLSAHQRLQYLSMIILFIIALGTHSWLFIEQHFVKTIMSPIILLLSGAVYDQAYGSQNPPQNPNNTAPAIPTSTSAPVPPEDKKKEEDVFDPLSLDETRVKILLSLNDRDIELKKREAALQEKESMIKVEEVQLDKKRTELLEMKKVVENIAQGNNDEVLKNIKKMIAVYEAMKPQAAARIFNELPLQVLTDLIKHMNPRKSSSIIALMDVGKAKALTDNVAFAPYVPESSGK